MPVIFYIRLTENVLVIVNSANYGTILILAFAE